MAIYIIYAAVFLGVAASVGFVAFFINGKETDSADLAVIVDGVRALPGHLRKAYRDIRDSAAKEKKRKRRKKNPNSSA